jgi:hypothetical protein
MMMKEKNDGGGAEGIYDGWCNNHEVPFSLQELGEDAWPSGCPLCGYDYCREDDDINFMTKNEQKT